MSLETETGSNLTSFYKRIAMLSGLPTGEANGISYVLNPDGSWPSYVFGGGKLSTDIIGEICEKMRNRELPAFWLREIVPGDEFAASVAEYGIRQINLWSGMEMVKETIFGRLAPSRDITIERITGERELREWLDVVNHEVMSGKTIDYRLFRPALNAPEFEFFRILRQKKTVATLLGFRNGDTTGIYMVSTKSEFRGKGYGTWITSEAMDYFIRKGFRKFVLHSTSAGYPVYKKLGFTENSHFGIFWMVGKF